MYIVERERERSAGFILFKIFSNCMNIIAFFSQLFQYDQITVIIQRHNPKNRHN